MCCLNFSVLLMCVPRNLNEFVMAIGSELMEMGVLAVGEREKYSGKETRVISNNLKMLSQESEFCNNSLGQG